ncbi:phenylalanyl-tRNA synthetase, beta subunit [Pyrolobus fumarii 1A]|uniref:Phenylalanine--tRNA ligase beta subunit n=1 Tax=Pyrolobus fumarii (strain DSM 11204 / 1A) TaxID=694429 RepID=G0EGF8_PYRF1|nr:phenylalanine--tRNA ligase subunit beta [Pyrolobus fumarii]AEM39183.1 phenylalanyl-tRNA synthetase, beta subunit [Pyrolobus fumarii 1A]
MPTLRFLAPRLFEAIGSSVTRQELEELLFRLKCETEWGEGDEVYVEVNADRPDMFSVEGIARAVRGLLGIETGLPSYEHVPSGFTLRVESVPSRPFIAAGVVYDVYVDGVFLEELIQFQEKLHETLGRGRRRVAIGIHDLEKVPSKNLVYREVNIDEVRFTPLHGDREMSVREILAETEQGRKYGAISLRGDRHPVFATEDGVVLSLPPVINADVTRVEPGTRHLLIDVTGTSWEAVKQVLNVLVYTLAERSRSKRVGIVRLVGAPESETPVWSTRSITASHERIVAWLGARLEPSDVVDALERMRHNAEYDAGAYTVEAAPYRVDVSTWVDVAEDVAIGIGYDRVGWQAPPPTTRGSLSPIRGLERSIRVILAGYGFQEVYSFTLTSCERQEELGAVPTTMLVRVANPVSRELACLRASITPQLLELAAQNQHIVPLRIFEMGDVALVDESRPEKVRIEKHLAILLMDERVGYEDIQSYVWGLVRLLGDEIREVEEVDHPLLIPGRAARIKTRDGLEGILGEVHPAHLEKLEIRYPVAIAELRYDTVAKPRLANPYKALHSS